MSESARRLAFVLALGSAITPAAGCKRHRRGGIASHRQAGPALGNSSSTIHATRIINPQRVAVTAPFDTVIALPSATLGIAGGRLFRLVAAQQLGGAPVDPFDGRMVRALAAAGGDVVYALVNAERPFIARSTDAGATWIAGAAVSESETPPRAGDPRFMNPESAPGMAAAGLTVVFWMGENALISRDGGSTVAPLALGAIVRSLAVSDAGTVIALARNPEAGEGPGFLLVRVDRAGATRTMLPSTDTCTAAKVRRLDTGLLMLGDSTHLLGVCARVSRDDGRTFTSGVNPRAAPGAITQLLATESGVLLESHAAAGTTTLSFSQDNGETEVPLDRALIGLAFDIAPDNTIAVGLSDAMARLPGTGDAAAATQFHALLVSDVRYRLAFTAARDAIATLDPRGTVTVVTPGPEGPRWRQLASPCRFPGENFIGLDLPLLSLDGLGHVCCASARGGFDGQPGGAACADLASDRVAWRPIAGIVEGVSSGDGAMAVIAREPRCILDGEPEFAQPIAMLDLPAETSVRDVSCSRNGAVAAAVRTGTFTNFTPMQLRAANAHAHRAELENAIGTHSHFLARADGTVIAAFDDPTGIVVRRWRAENPRALADWRANPAMLEPSVLAAWDAHTTILSMRTALLVAGPAGFAHRAFAEGERYEAVARIGNALVGVTSAGRFAVLEAR